MHTKDILADALIEAGLPALAAQAREGHYHDYLSPLDSPTSALTEELLKAGTQAALGLRHRVINGDFDASLEEANEWARSQDGQAAFAALVEGSPAATLEKEFESLVAASWPAGLPGSQKADIRKCYLAGAIVMFNLFGVEAKLHGGIRPEFLALINAKFATLTGEFKTEFDA